MRSIHVIVTVRWVRVVVVVVGMWLSFIGSFRGDPKFIITIYITRVYVSV